MPAGGDRFNVIDGDNGQQVPFTRQPDGSLYLRTVNAGRASTPPVALFVQVKHYRFTLFTHLKSPEHTSTSAIMYFPTPEYSSPRKYSRKSRAGNRDQKVKRRNHPHAIIFE